MQVVCTKCEHCRYIHGSAYTMYYCHATPSKPKYSCITGQTYKTGLNGFRPCDEINSDGHCPKYESRMCKWWQVWKWRFW